VKIHKKLERQKKI